MIKPEPAERSAQGKQSLRSRPSDLLSLTRMTLATLWHLAVWRLQQSWGMLTVMGVGIMVAVILVCVVPPYALVAMSAGVRSVFRANPEQTYISVKGDVIHDTLSAGISAFQAQLDQDLQRRVGDMVNLHPQFTVQTSFSLNADHPLPDPANLEYTLACNGYDDAAVAPHITVLQGRLPRVNDKTIEFMLTPDAANLLHIQLGTVLTAPLLYLYSGGVNATSTSLPPLPQTQTFTLVGLFHVKSASDLFWHGQSFLTGAVLAGPKENLIPQAIIANDGFLHTYDTLTRVALQNGASLSNVLAVSWYYTLAVPHLQADHLQSLLDGVNAFQMDIANSEASGFPNATPDVTNVEIFAPTALLSSYIERVSAALVPIVLLTLLMFFLVLFFISLICDLLIERQSEVIALLRSRGASQQQVFGALSVQGILLGIIALLCGPLLAPFLAIILVRVILAGNDQGALNLLANPLQIAWGLRWFALVTVLIVLGTLLLGIYRAARLDILRMRRETARARRRSLFQNLPWDVVLLIVAAVIYGSSFYVVNTGIVDAQLQVLLVSPLILASSVCVILAGSFLFLRLFPRILDLVAKLAARARGASSLLALAQMARVPRRVLHMMLLLMLTSAFATFALAFVASQAQRIPDIATYQAGADFSGTLVNPQLIGQPSLTQQTATYRHIPGVLAASLGNVSALNYAAGSQNVAIEQHAVDANTFAQSALWVDQDTPSLSALMAQLRAQRTGVLTTGRIPAIVDAAAWNALHLSLGAHFTLNDAQGPLTYVAIAEVAHIPTISDSSNGTSGGVLIDYQSYEALYSRQFHIAPPLTNVWLRVDPHAIATVRATLTQGNLQLSPLYDRYATMVALSYDPLYLTLLGILILGATLPLILALVSNLLSSWFSARARLTNFAVLRALGSTPRQILAMLAWEQGGVYVLALILGGLAGIIFSLLSLPVLVFTGVAARGVGSTTSGNAFFTLQNVPPIHIVFPPTLVLIFLVLLVCSSIALGLMGYLIVRASLGQVLRLNAD